MLFVRRLNYWSKIFLKKTRKRVGSGESYAD